MRNQPQNKYPTLNGLSNQELIDIVNNHHQYDRSLVSSVLQELFMYKFNTEHVNEASQIVPAEKTLDSETMAQLKAEMAQEEQSTKTLSPEAMEQLKAELSKEEEQATKTLSSEALEQLKAELAQAEHSTKTIDPKFMAQYSEVESLEVNYSEGNGMKKSYNSFLTDYMLKSNYKDIQPVGAVKAIESPTIESSNNLLVPKL